MSVDFDIDLPNDADCGDCELDEQCCINGCLFRLKVGPCDAFNKSTGEVDLSMMCTPKTATAHTPNFIHPLREYEFRNSCRITRKAGTPDCNIDIDVLFCENDPAMRYLLGKCPITICMVPNAPAYDLSGTAASQTTPVIRGHFIGSDWTWNNEFQECQSTSRNFSCTGAVWGETDWLDNLPEIAGLAARREELRTIALDLDNNIMEAA